jgi:2-keto-4-pentenoate hydratase/2-oxohepta-3-ene-1,7-dioic acid hydratase in catechol pathway
LIVRLFRTAHGWARQSDDEYAILVASDAEIMQLLVTDPSAVESLSVISRLPRASTKLLPPVGEAPQLVLVGANYRSHIAEASLATPTRPGGLRFEGTMVCGPGDAIVLPAEAPDCVDYEGEIAVVIGSPCHDLAPGQGWNHIAGITAGNDVSARDVQLKGMRDGRVVDMQAIRRGKGFPTFKPLGPCLLSVDEVRARGPLVLTTTVNDEERQHATTDDMIFDLGQVVEGVSTSVELLQGDVIFTGTPAGVGLVAGRFLSDGDLVEVAIEGVGRLTNRVVPAGGRVTIDPAGDKPADLPSAP